MAEHLTVEDLKNWQREKNASLHEKNKDNQMKTLREILESKITILSEKKSADGDVMNVRVNWAESDKKTGNGRIYKKDLLQREIERLQKSVEKKALIGTGDHPSSGISDIKTASHIVTAMSMDENGKTWADLKIIPTDRGKNIQTLIKSGATLGVSSRGAGSVDEKTGEVKDDYRLLGIDIVANPSYAGGTFNTDNIMESLDFDEEKSMPSEEAMQEFLQLNFKTFQENRSINAEVMLYDEWLAENEAAVRAVALVDLYHIYPSVEEALEAMGEISTLKKLKLEEETHIYTASEVFLEARFSGVSPDLFAKKLNEIEERKRVDLSSGFSEDETRNLIEEAEKSGKNMKDPAERKKLFEFAKTQVTLSEKTIHEKAKEWQAKALVEGRNYNLETLEEILRKEEKVEETKKKRQIFLGQIERDLEVASPNMGLKELREFKNKMLRRRGMEILNEEGE